MPKSQNRLLRALNPIRYPWEAAKAPALILYQRLMGGGNWGAFWTSPWGTYGTLKWLFEDYAKGPQIQHGPGLDVGSTDTGVQGFAIYGTVRVSGTSVIPPC